MIQYHDLRNFTAVFRYSVNEVVTMLENDEEFMSADIFISPPSDSDSSDADSGPEDGGGIVDNLPRNLLRASAHAIVRRGHGNDDIGNEESAETENSERGSTEETADETADKTVASNPIKRKRSVPKKQASANVGASIENQGVAVQQKRRKSNRSTASPASSSPDNDIHPTASADADISSHEPPAVPRKWKKVDVKTTQPEWNGSRPDFLQRDMTPSFIFDSFWDDDVIKFTVSMTNMYASQKGVANFNVNPDEVRGMLAILLISGYVSLPSRRMFWEQSDDVANAAVSSIMSLNRFEEILRYLHFADNLNLPPGDKMAKVRPLFDMMNERYMKFWPVEQDVNVDESMIPYFGRHSAKQFIRGKPIRFGFKVWCLNTRLGYLVQCDPYQGKGSYLDPQFGLGGSVVRYLMTKLPKLNYCLYIDNYFTSLRLLDQLRRDQIAAVGTIRSNRVEKCPLKDISLMKKDERGTLDYRTDVTTGTTVVRWQDNSIVTIASNTFGIEPMGRVKRWSAAKNTEVFVPQPHLIAKYNYGMGRTDRMDQNIQCYRIGLRCKKWWWQLFAYHVDVAVQNGWLLYRQTPAHDMQPMSLLQFRRSIVQTYVMKYKSRDHRKAIWTFQGSGQTSAS